MSIEFHVRNVDESAPIGAAKSVRMMIEHFFPETVWNSSKVAECSTDVAFVQLTLNGRPVRRIDIQIVNPEGNLIYLRLIAMARSQGCVVIDNGSGENIELEFPKSESRINAIMKMASKSIRGSKATKSLPKLPRILWDAVLSESDLIAEASQIALVSLNDDETTDNIFEMIRPVVFPNGQDFDFKLYPMSANEEILLPNGQRFAVLFYTDSRERTAGGYIISKYIECTHRIGGQVENRFLKCSDGTRFRCSDCKLIKRRMGRGRKS